MIRLNELLKERNLPSLLKREEMLDILQEEMYGHMPPKPDEVTWEVQEEYVKRFCANKASFSKVTIKSELLGQQFSFPMYCVIPKA